MNRQCPYGFVYPDRIQEWPAEEDMVPGVEQGAKVSVPEKLATNLEVVKTGTGERAVQTGRKVCRGTE